MIDFRFRSHGSVWSCEAVSDRARAFAEQAFFIEPWQGTSRYFYTDWRPAQELREALILDHDFTVESV